MENKKISMWPECPKCEEGVLVPFSFKEDVFEFWRCTKCGHEMNKKERGR